MCKMRRVRYLGGTDPFNESEELDWFVSRLFTFLFILLYSADELGQSFLLFETAVFDTYETYHIIFCTVHEIVRSLAPFSHLRMALTDFLLIGVKIRHESLQTDSSVIERFTLYIMYNFFILRSLCFISLPYTSKFVLSVICRKDRGKKGGSYRFLIRPRIADGNFTSFTVFIVNHTSIYYKFIPISDVFEFFSVYRHLVTLRNQIDHVDRLTVVTEAFLTGMTIIFSEP